ncbi:oligosaccharide flippase family protein [Halorussus salinisoli]|uniref:oligosaccharide flippase family protein n=1 Tax=Halorussus salinisoli TaxID=2558242 RepID=UPI0010C23AED|nr:oligosaccharide flippase family protein [Halorussus salinisoli]
MSSDSPIDHSEIQSALESISLSAILILGATLLSQGLGFVTRITMARYLPVDGYGNVVLGIAMLNLLGIIVLAGMPPALSRYIPRFESTGERQEIVVSSFHIVVVLSLIVSVVVYLLTVVLPRSWFGDVNLIRIFRIFALVIPFYAVIKLSIGSFRGYETTFPQIITDKVLLPGSRLVFIVLFVLAGYDTVGIALAHAVAFLVIAIGCFVLVHRVGSFSLTDFFHRGSMNRYRELLVFSAPLAASGGVNIIAKHSDVVLLGIFKSSTEAGTYELAFRMSLFLIFFFSPAIDYLFQPIVSRFHSEERFDDMDSLYTLTTRWIVVATFPVFVLFFLFSDQTMTFFFSDRYRAGGIALSILAFGAMVSRLPGLTGSILISTGRTKTIMYISFGTAFCNVFLNIVLIPFYGITGAAMATAATTVLNNILEMYIVYNMYEIHPFEREFVLPTMLIATIFGIISVSPVRFSDFSFLYSVVIAGGFGAVYLSLFLLTRSIYQVELHLVDQLFQRLGFSVRVSKTFQLFTR